MELGAVKLVSIVDIKSVSALLLYNRFKFYCYITGFSFNVI
jgi:hypothetical protein